MDNEQQLVARQVRRRTGILFTLLTAGILLLLVGFDAHIYVLQGVGMAMMNMPWVLAATIFSKEPPFPWRKERVLEMVLTSFLVGCVLWTLAWSAHNFLLVGLSCAAYIAPVAVVWIVARRKTAQAKEQQANR